MVVLHLFVFPDILGLGTRDIHQFTASSVTGRHVNFPILINRSGDHSGPSLGPLGSPKQLSGSSIDPRQSFHEELNVLFLPIHFRDDHGRILGAIRELLTPPNRLPCFFIGWNNCKIQITTSKNFKKSIYKQIYLYKFVLRKNNIL